MTELDITKSNLESLASLLSLKAEQSDWTSEDFRDMLAHQLSSPMLAELVEFEPANEETLTQALSSSETRIETVRDALMHLDPPREGLMAIKRFAKTQGQSPDGLPLEIAGLLYVAAISAARLRCESISEMSDQTLADRIHWALSQAYLDEELRGLFEETLAAV